MTGVSDYCPVCGENIGDAMKEHLAKYDKDQLITGLLKLLDEYQDYVYESWGEDN